MIKCHITYFGNTFLEFRLKIKISDTNSNSNCAYSAILIRNQRCLDSNLFLNQQIHDYTVFAVSNIIYAQSVYDYKSERDCDQSMNCRSEQKQKFEVDQN